MPDFEADAQAEVQQGGRKRKGANNANPAPRRRKLSGNEHICVSSADAHPAWVSKALALLQSEPLGPEWDGLVRSWLQFEQDAGLESGHKLGSQRRPRVVGDWIQRARTPKFRPEITNPDQFVEDFDAWWRGLQPDWRLDNASDLLCRDGGDWERLRCAGVNGLLSVLAALFFWGVSAQRGAASFKLRWLAAVEDVSYVIGKLI